MDNDDNLLYGDNKEPEYDYISPLPNLTDISQIILKHLYKLPSERTDPIENENTPFYTNDNTTELIYHYYYDLNGSCLDSLEESNALYLDDDDNIAFSLPSIDEELPEITYPSNSARDNEDSQKSIEDENLQNKKCIEVETKKVDESRNERNSNFQLDESNKKNKVEDEDDELLDLKGVRFIKEKLSQTTVCEKCHKKCYLEETVQYKDTTTCFNCLRKIPLNQWHWIRDREWKHTELTKTRTCKHCKSRKSFYRYQFNVITMSFQYCNYCEMKRAWRNSFSNPKYKKRSHISKLFGDLE